MGKALRCFHDVWPAISESNSAAKCNNVVLTAKLDHSGSIFFQGLKINICLLFMGS